MWKKETLIFNCIRHTIEELVPDNKNPDHAVGYIQGKFAQYMSDLHGSLDRKPLLFKLYCKYQGVLYERYTVHQCACKCIQFGFTWIASCRTPAGSQLTTFTYLLPVWCIWKWHWYFSYILHVLQYILFNQRCVEMCQGALRDCYIVSTWSSLVCSKVL